MNGVIDESGRALLTVEVLSETASEVAAVQVWVDTGFTGDLVLSHKVIASLGLVRSGSVDAILADGSQIELDTFTCYVRWFGQDRRLEVVANEGDCPLLGVGMLLGLELRANYFTLELALDAPEVIETGH